LQAVFGIEQMKKLPERTRLKKKLYFLYRKYLTGVKAVQFIATDLQEVSPWFMDVLVPDPLALQRYLKNKNIGSRVVYPAIHAQPVYSWAKGNFPVASRIGRQGLWLPSASFLKEKDIRYICQTIKNFYSQK